MTSKINIAFVIPSLRAGGAERVMSTIAQGLDKDHFSVTLIVVGYEKDAAYKTQGIETVFLNKPKVRSAIFALFKYLFSHKIDIAISAIAHLNTVMALLSPFFPKTKFVGRETIVKSGKLAYSEPQKQRFQLGSLQKYLLDMLICQSQDMKQDLIENYEYPEKKLTVINNPVSEQFKLKSAIPSHKTLQLITIGRLEQQKGYPRLLQALSKLDVPFHYKIIGKGSLLNDILSTAKTLGIDDKLEYIEFTDKVQAHLQESHIYVQGSYVEGFPNALLESCAVGTPVVAFEAPGGINEIVMPGVNGYTATNDVEFVEGIKKVMENKDITPEKVRKSVFDKYSADIILSNYERFFKQLLNG